MVATATPPRDDRRVPPAGTSGLCQSHQATPDPPSRPTLDEEGTAAARRPLVPGEAPGVKPMEIDGDAERPRAEASRGNGTSSSKSAATPFDGEDHRHPGTQTSRHTNGHGPEAAVGVSTSEGDDDLSADLRTQLVAQIRAYRHASRALSVPAPTAMRARLPSPATTTAHEGNAKDVASADSSARAFLARGEARIARLARDREGEIASKPLGSLASDAALELVIDAKQLKLAKLQRSLRQAMLCERRLMACGGRVDVLFDASRLARAKQDIGSLTFDERRGQMRNAQTAAIESAAQARTRAIRADEIAQQNAALQRKRLEEERQAAEDRRRMQEAYERAQAEHAAKARVVQARKAFLQGVMAHREHLRKGESGVSYQEMRHYRKRRCETMQVFHNRERKKRIRAANARVLALKSDNIEEYLRMAKEAKNSRVSTLLENTESLLVELGMKVSDQRAEQAGTDSQLAEYENFVFGRTKDREEGGGSDDDALDVEDNLLQGQKRYLSLVHSKSEGVAEQPRCLEGGSLRQYQLAGLQWMVSLYINGLNGILADEMGLGKTIQTISLVAYLMETKSNFGPHLIICPKAVLSNWTNEFERWLSAVNVVLYDGKPEERKALREDRMANQTFNVLLTHYDMIMRDKKTLTKIQWEYIIVDEGHRLKNKDSKLSEILRGSYEARNRLLLTGTPIQNNLKELWSLLNFVLPKVFDTSDSFDDWFSAPFQGAMEDVTLSEEEELLIIHRLHQVIRPFLLRRKKSEVEKELPNKSEVILKCDLSAWQKAYYKQITDTGSVQLETPKGKSKAKSLMNSAMQLRKACIHPYLFLDNMSPPYAPDDDAEYIRASGKFDILDRILPKLKAAGHRVLLFSQMTRSMDLLEYYLEMKGYIFLRLDGETKTNERPQLLAEFNAPGSDVFLFMLSTRAGGLGLNLQTADTVILFDSDWNPQMDKQAEDRAHRIGQKKEVKIITIVSVGSIEEVILERARQKADIDNKVIQAGMFNQTSSHSERQETLAALFKRGIEDIGKGINTDAEINALIARNAEEEEAFNAMDAARYAEEANGPPRLMQDDEIPEWAVRPPDPEPKEGGEEGGEGTGVLGPRRAKAKNISYDDGLSDTMWAKLVDQGADAEELQERAQAGRERKRRRER